MKPNRIEKNRKKWKEKASSLPPPNYSFNDKESRKGWYLLPVPLFFLYAQYTHVGIYSKNLEEPH